MGFGGLRDLWHIELVKNSVEATHMLKKVFVTQLAQHQFEFIVVFQSIPVFVDNRNHVLG